jgi:hypothetical protein
MANSLKGLRKKGWMKKGMVGDGEWQLVVRE